MHGQENIKLVITLKYSDILIFRYLISDNSLVQEMPGIATFTLLLSQQKFLIALTRNANLNFIIESLLSLLRI